MIEAWVAVIVFACLLGASLIAMFISPVLRAHHRDDETNAVVRLIANIFVVMTSLVFGLMINSAKNTYAGIDTNVHAFATNLIILDRTLRNYGIGGVDAREKLVVYVKEAIEQPLRPDDATTGKPDVAGHLLDALGDSLAALKPLDDYHGTLLVDIRQQYRRLVEQRWAIIEQSEGNIPAPIIVMLIAWLTLIFGSFGYRAPHNAIVAASFGVAALLIASAFYLVLDMNSPFAGTIQISDAPLRRAFAEMQR